MAPPIMFVYMLAVVAVVSDVVAFVFGSLPYCFFFVPSNFFIFSLVATVVAVAVAVVIVIIIIVFVASGTVQRF